MTPPPPRALTALLVLVALGACTGLTLAGVLAARLQSLRADVAAARHACPCCEEPAP